MRRLAILLALFAAVFYASRARAQEIDETELEDRVQDAIEQATDDVTSDLDLEDVEASGLDVDDAISDVDVSDITDPADVLADLDFQRQPAAGGTVKRGGARDPNKRVNDLLYSQSPKVRAAGARAIANLNSIISVGPLTLALGDRSPLVRKAVADSLAGIGDFEALGALKRALPREKDPKVSRAMDKAIGAIEDRLFAGPGGGGPVTISCPDGRKFVLLRKVSRGFCPYDGSPWTMK